MSLDLRNVPYRTEDADRQSASLQNLLRRATMTKFASLFLGTGRGLQPIGC